MVIWLETVLINGSLCGYEPNSPEGIRVYTQTPSNAVFTDWEGCFYGLDYITENTPHPYWVHQCTVTAKNDTTEQTYRVDELYQIVSFSGGSMYVSINMTESDESTTYVTEQGTTQSGNQNE